MKLKKGELKKGNILIISCDLFYFYICNGPGVYVVYIEFLVSVCIFIFSASVIVFNLIHFVCFVPSNLGPVLITTAQ